MLEFPNIQEKGGEESMNSLPRFGSDEYGGTVISGPVKHIASHAVSGNRSKRIDLFLTKRRHWMYFGRALRRQDTRCQPNRDDSSDGRRQSDGISRL